MINVLLFTNKQIVFPRTHSWRRRRRRNLLTIDIKLSYQKLNIAWVNQSMAGCQKSWPPYITFRIWHIYIQSNSYTKEEQKTPPPPSTAKANIKNYTGFNWFIAGFNGIASRQGIRRIPPIMFAQWGSGKISLVDVATMWSHWPYYRSVVNTLMVGLPLYQ